MRSRSAHPCPLDADSFQICNRYFGTRGGTRTLMAFRPRDFKSLASTGFATRAVGAHLSTSIRAVAAQRQ